jgi:hypothetical protein
MATTPTTEPARIVAGDTVSWTKSFTDYPASVWTLKYRLINSTTKIDITATASGDDYAIAVASATTVNWVAGKYDYTAWVEKTGERVTVGSGRMEVAPNLAALTTYDARSDARKIYEALLAAYQTRATGGQTFVAEYEIAGRKMKFTDAAGWLNQINYWKSQVAAEDRAAKIAAGLGGGSRVLVRF